MAKGFDVVIVAVGENPLRYMPDEKTSGENVARSDIRLPGNQLDLVKKLYETGVPVVVVLVNGRPLGIEWIAEHIPAVIEAFEPGACGGKAVAEIISGKVNPSGKLPITFPRNAGQIVTRYNHKSSAFVQNYAMGSNKPLFQFGYGLSYTEFKFERIEVMPEKIKAGKSATASITVTNIGQMAGVEVVQLYIRDDYSSVTRPVKELKGFQRIYLASGETRRIEFEITPGMLSFYRKDMTFGIEPGIFTIMAGNSSRDEDLLRSKLEVK
jgi:beta-glucosidase